jgi:uncharacterized membrane protein YdjX (TVP38/TMEM64 family)
MPAAAQMPDTSRRWKKLAILALFVAGLAAFFALGGGKFLNLEALKANREVLLSYTREHYWTMVAVMIGVYTASTAFSIPGAVVLSLATGFLFGRWAGTAIIVFSATIGATLVFLAARYVFAEAAQRRMGSLAAAIVRGFHENAFSYLLFLRLVPLFPFWLVNLAPAFTPISVRTYVLATAVGIVPGSFVFANLGQSLGRIESSGQLLSGETLIALVLLGLLALVPILVRQFQARRK